MIIGEHAGMALQSGDFKGNQVLQQIDRRMRRGIRPAPPNDDPVAIQTVQRGLKKLGHDVGEDWQPGSPPSGWYGAGTKAAVTAFQRRAFPDTPADWDGAFGPRTLGVMDTWLARQLPGFPDDPGPDGPHPSGVILPTDPAAVRFDHPMFMGIGVKLSLQDPIFLPIIGGFLAPLGISVPHGADIVICGLHKVTKVTEVKSVMAAGIVLGVTDRRGATPLGLGQAIAAAKKHGADPKVIQFLEQLSARLSFLPTGGALSAGLEFTVATGFANVGAMDGYVSGPEDEATISAAFGPTKGLGKWATLILEAISGTVDLLKDGFLPVLEAMKTLTTKNVKALTALDIPGLSLGVDVGVFAGRTTWHAFDVEAALRRLENLVAGGTVTTAAPPRALLKVPFQPAMRVRHPIS